MPIKEMKKIQKIETDIVIAGAGGSGLAAATAAAERGARVIVLEKRGAVGGNATFAEGIFASESPAQHRAAVEVRNDDMFRLAMDFAHWKLNGGLMRAFINKSGDTIRWLEEKGVKFDVLAFSAKQTNRVFHNPPEGGPAILRALLKSCADLGVRVIPGMAVENVLKDKAGRVTGVTATGMGMKFHINAKSVIIATGGFAGNKKLLKKLCRFDTRSSSTPGILHQGDGIVMAMDAGANTEGMGRLQMSGPSFSGQVPAMNSVALEPDVLWLNAKGERFTDESTSFNDFQSVNAVLRQPGKFCFVFLDDKIVKNIQQKGLIRVYPGSLRPTRGPIPELDKYFRMVEEGKVAVAQVNPDICNGCGICMAVCPRSTIDLDTTAGKAISTCQSACPAGVDMRRYLYYLHSGKMKEAYEVLRESLPLPAVTGRVCPHFCEKECARSDVDEAVNINSLERFVADYWLEEKAMPVTRKHKEKVAIVGSGPAGLACAYFLVRLGYPVTVFEAQPKPGGMLRVGIPEYRLPRVILDEQIEYIEDMGVEFRTGVAIGKDIKFEALREEYGSVFFAIGNQLSRKIRVEGIGLEGVLWGLDFLRSVNLNNKPRLKGSVVVIGGGNVALDVALTAHRMGAEDIQIACLESGNEIPAYKEEIDEAADEGIDINEGWGPQRILGSNGKVTGIELVRCTRVYDSDGKFNPAFDKSTTKKLKADTIILAIGQTPDTAMIPAGTGATDTGVIPTDPITMATKLPGVFAGGDITSGTASVVKAIADGKAAAVSIDRYLRGKDMKEGRSTAKTVIEKPPKEGITLRDRIPAPVKQPEKIAGNFEEIKPGFDELMALQEVQRCMTCGSKSVINIENCHSCRLCETQCPVQAVESTPAKKIRPLGKISDNLDKIADWMGADPAVLRNTIEEYNGYCDNGYDAMFTKERQYLHPLRTPPYYIFRCGTVYLTTLGGIRIDQHMEVLDKEENVIPGLFACGNDTGGYESDTYCVLLPGSTFGYAINSGRIAGENAAKYVAGE